MSEKSGVGLGPLFLKQKENKMSTQDHRATRRSAKSQSAAERKGSNPAKRKSMGSTVSSGMRKSKPSVKRKARSRY